MNRQASRCGSTRIASRPLARRYEESPRPRVTNSSRSTTANASPGVRSYHGRVAKIGYSASLEQFHPNDLLTWCAEAEAAGFDAGFMISEHFHPWTPQQGQSAF